MRVPPVPRISRPAVTLGLPFGVRVDEGRVMCWSCGREIPGGDLVREAPQLSVCPGCGARLPFAE